MLKSKKENDHNWQEKRWGASKIRCVPYESQRDRGGGKYIRFKIRRLEFR